MRLTFLLLFCLVLRTAHAQTERIATYSHNGTARAQTTKNIPGIPTINLRVDSIVFINDSTVMQYSNLGNHQIKYHPIANDPKISADSLKKIYPDAKLVGFEKKKLQAGMFSVKHNGNSFAWLWLPGIVAALAGCLGLWQTKRRAA